MLKDAICILDLLSAVVYCFSRYDSALTIHLPHSTWLCLLQDMALSPQAFLTSLVDVSTSSQGSSHIRDTVIKFIMKHLLIVDNEDAETAKVEGVGEGDGGSRVSSVAKVNDVLRNLLIGWLVHRMEESMCTNSSTAAASAPSQEALHTGTYITIFFFLSLSPFLLTHTHN